MNPTKLLSVFVLSFCLLCSPAFAPADAAAADKGQSTAKVTEHMDKGAMSDMTASKKKDAAKAGVPETVDTLVMTVIPPSTDIIVTFPLLLTERGVVEAVNANMFTLKRQDGSTATIVINDNTLVENVYADIFNWKSDKGIGDLKKGDKVRARVFQPNASKEEVALLVDVFHW